MGLSSRRLALVIFGAAVVALCVGGGARNHRHLSRPTPIRAAVEISDYTVLRHLSDRQTYDAALFEGEPVWRMSTSGGSGIADAADTVAADAGAAVVAAGSAAFLQRDAPGRVDDDKPRPPVADVQLSVALPAPPARLSSQVNGTVDVVLELSSWNGLEIAPDEPPAGDLPSDAIYQVSLPNSVAVGTRLAASAERERGGGGLQLGSVEPGHGRVDSVRGRPRVGPLVDSLTCCVDTSTITTTPNPTTIAVRTSASHQRRSRYGSRCAGTAPRRSWCQPPGPPPLGTAAVAGLSPCMPQLTTRTAGRARSILIRSWRRRQKVS
mmetsp:Transcript_7652/g.19663  ORF Transcript_7652/g.19663 Transcript_7652/m.19663 type:complete len:323 (-) Transcript_7652:82-1050(-)